MAFQDNLKPTPSTFKAELKKLDVPLSHVSSFLRISYPHFVNCINGIAPLNNNVEDQLKNLIQKLKNEKKPTTRTLEHQSNARSETVEG